MTQHSSLTVGEGGEGCAKAGGKSELEGGAPATTRLKGKAKLKASLGKVCRQVIVSAA
jgi:hypothetical protein